MASYKPEEAVGSVAGAVRRTRGGEQKQAILYGLAPSLIPPGLREEMECTALSGMYQINKFDSVEGTLEA